MVAWATVEAVDWMSNGGIVSIVERYSQQDFLTDWVWSWKVVNDGIKVLAKFLCKVWENGGSGWGCQAPVVKRIWVFRIRWTWFKFQLCQSQDWIDFEEVV